MGTFFLNAETGRDRCSSEEEGDEDDEGIESDAMATPAGPLTLATCRSRLAALVPPGPGSSVADDACHSEDAVQALASSADQQRFMPHESYTQTVVHDKACALRRSRRPIGELPPSRRRGDLKVDLLVKDRIHPDFEFEGASDPTREAYCRHRPGPLHSTVHAEAGKGTRNSIDSILSIMLSKSSIEGIIDQPCNSSAVTPILKFRRPHAFSLQVLGPLAKERTAE